MRKYILFFSIFVFGSLFLWQWLPVYAADCEQISCPADQADDDYLDCNKQKQQCWQTKISEAQSAQITLGNTINILNGQISVQELQISQTQKEVSIIEKQIDDLTTRISGLNLSLDKLSEMLVDRVGEHYKRLTVNPVLALVAQGSINQTVSEFHYLKTARQQTLEAMERAETQRITYDEQKTLKETKQLELEAKQAKLQSQQATLTKQRAEQQYLLQDTKNNEAKYQSELAKTLAELSAIQSIIAGGGNEAEAGKVNQGDRIASVIAGASVCSTGTHLHFEVVRDGLNQNPADYLKSIDVTWDNQPDGSFGSSGSWDWPLDNAARITQGYGMTYYARVRRAYGGSPHTGIDMFSKSAGSYTVKAVQSGTLYRGSIPCGSGNLRYVRVKHQDSNLSTYYLHVNY